MLQKAPSFRILGLAWLATCFAINLNSPQHGSDQLVFTSGALHDPYSDVVITPDFSTYVEELLKREGVPGYALGVIHADGRSEYGMFGNRTEGGEPVDVDTLFDLASCSKAFLAASMGILIDDYAHNRNNTPLPPNLATFDWDTKVQDLLPNEWNLMEKWANEKASVKDILSHMSGMPRHDLSYGRNDTLDDIVTNLQHLRPAFELRERWSYNNQMYMVGAYIITKYTNDSYTTFASNRIFKPLNMTSTTFSPNKALASGKLTQMWTGFGRRIPFWFTEENVELNAGAGGVISSVADLDKWVRTMLNAGVNPSTNTTAIPRAAFDAVTTAHAVSVGKSPSPDESIEGYGMGWFRQSYLGREVISHDGSIPGISTRIAFLPSDGLGIITLANADNKAKVNGEVVKKAIRKALGLHGKKDMNKSQAASPTKLENHVHAQNNPYTALSLPIANYSGTYTSKGYGTFTLCDASASGTISSYCAQVLSDFDAVDSVTTTPRSTSHQLFAAWSRLWSSHIRLVHSSGDRFHISPTSLFPDGYGRNRSAFEKTEPFTSAMAEFVVKDGGVIGLGWIGTVDDTPITKRQRQGGGVESEADVWFDKI